ncbi:cation transporter [Siculibacillus lacustris]|uniref:Cation transporter n=1 Tax=Siculibacillus lacustris TaxID=1549641 RepID=A0A4V2KTD0_9HYPH|nr:cation diffusion facilitator family transporter [Siculibacillus lacustris]TBW36779.1 cation transporter [Siculibacillus lacustris]
MPQTTPASPPADASGARVPIDVAVGSIGVGIVVLGLKILAYSVTGSIALYSDVLESLVNLATAVATLVAVRVAALPADATYPFGHHKAEYFSAVLEAVMIGVAAMLILREARDALVLPRTMTAPFLGMAINAAAAGINGLWCVVLVGHGRRHRSPALIADGMHLLADLASSVGVLTGIALAVATGWWIVDPLLAVIVAGCILWSGWIVLERSLGGLMDVAAPAERVAEIRRSIAAATDDDAVVRRLRTRTAGRATFVEFHLVVPGHLSVAAADAIAAAVETRLRADIPAIAVMIRIEPATEAAPARTGGGAESKSM